MGMKQQNALAMMTMLAMSNDAFRDDMIAEEKVRKNKPIKTIIPKGLKEFFYSENSVYALNQKVADKKAKRKGYL